MGARAYRGRALAVAIVVSTASFVVGGVESGACRRGRGADVAGRRVQREHTRRDRRRLDRGGATPLLVELLRPHVQLGLREQQRQHHVRHRRCPTYTPFSLTTDVGTPIIAPFFADVDTRGVGSGLVHYGATADNKIFCVNWVNVGYFPSKIDKLNSFQLLLIDRSSNPGGAPGDFDIVMNYDAVKWDTASGGSARRNVRARRVLERHRAHEQLLRVRRLGDARASFLDGTRPV